MSPTLAACVSDFLLWSGGLLLAVLIMGRFVRQPARRIALWWGTVVGIAALAILAISPRWSAVHLRSDFVQPMMNEMESPRGATGVPPVGIGDQRYAPKNHWRHASGTRPIAAPIDWPKLLLTVYLGGAAVTLGWLVLGYIAARRLVRSAKSASGRVAELAGQLGAERMPQLLVSDRLPSAVALGLRRPTVLLPREFCERVSAEELRSVLAHELAHVRHGDLWLLAALLCLAPLLWCQPLFWLLRRRVRLDQETLADAAAADHTTRPDYAANLIAWARTASGVRPAPLTATVGLWESPSQLKARIATLLDERLVLLRQTTRRWRLVSMIAIATLAGGMSLVTWAPAVAEGAAKQQAAMPRDAMLELKREYQQKHPFNPNVLQGKLVDESGQPLSGVKTELYVYNFNSPTDQVFEPIAVQTSDAEGEFRFSPAIDVAKVFPVGPPKRALSPSNGDLKMVAMIARVPGRAAQRLSMEASEIVVRGFSMAWMCPPAATLSGRVTDQTGRPIPGATVNADRFAGISTPAVLQFVSAALTDEEGRFSITDLEAYDEAEARRQHTEWMKKFAAEQKATGNVLFAGPGAAYEFKPRKVEVTHPDFVITQVAVASIPGEVNVTLRPGASIVGRALKRDGDALTPAAGAQIQLHREVKRKTENTPARSVDTIVEVRSARANEDGEYRISSLPEGKYILDAMVKDRTWVSPGLDTLIVKPGETVNAPDIYFTQGGILRVQLIDAKTKKPLNLPPNTLGYLNINPLPGGRWRFYQSEGKVTWSEEGRAERHISPGKYRYSASVVDETQQHSLYISYAKVKKARELQECEIVEGEVTEVTIPMYPNKPQAGPTVKIQVSPLRVPAEKPKSDKPSGNFFVPFGTPADQK